MNWRHCVEMIYMCGASILIGSLATCYLVGLWVYRLLPSGLSTLLVTCASVLGIYAYGFCFVWTLASYTLNFVCQKLEGVGEIFEEDRLNPSQLPNFEGVFDAVWVFTAYFTAAAAFFTLYFYI